MSETTIGQLGILERERKDRTESVGSAAKKISFLIEHHWKKGFIEGSSEVIEIFMPFIDAIYTSETTERPEVISQILTSFEKHREFIKFLKTGSQ